MIKIYRKTVTIKAEQFDGSDEMVEKYKMMDAGTMVGTQHSPELYIEGAGKVVVGDWIATGVNGEHWTIADDVFRKTYSELPLIPIAVSDWIEKCHKNKKPISVALDIEQMPKLVKDYFRNYQTEELWVELQDNFARAWLDGYQVKE